MICVLKSQSIFIYFKLVLHIQSVMVYLMKVIADLEMMIVLSETEKEFGIGSGL